MYGESGHFTALQGYMATQSEDLRVRVVCVGSTTVSLIVLGSIAVMALLVHWKERNAS